MPGLLHSSTPAKSHVAVAEHSVARPDPHYCPPPPSLTLRDKCPLLYPYTWPMPLILWTARPLPQALRSPGANLKGTQGQEAVWKEERLYEP